MLQMYLTFISKKSKILSNRCLKAENMMSEKWNYASAQKSFLNPTSA